MKCDGCSKLADTTGAIIEGKYGQYCRACRSNIQRPSLAMNAQHYRDKDRADNERDLLQPWDGRGKPNKDFIQNFPEEAHDIFSPEELAEFG